MADELPVDDAADAVGVHRTTIYYYIRRGYLKAHKLERSLDRRSYVDMDELRELLRTKPKRH